MGSKPIGISASRGASILGLSDYRTPVSAWLQLMEERHPGFCQAHGYIAPQRQDSAPLRWGSAFEDAVLVEAGKAMSYSSEDKKSKTPANIYDREGFYCAWFDGNPVTETNLVDSDSAVITCHIDGRYSDKILHEGKTTTDMACRMKWGTPGTDRVPSDYQVQTQHQMACTGADECIVSVLVFPDTQDALELLGWRVTKLESDTPETVTRKLTPSMRKKWASVLADMGFFHQYVVPSRKDVQKEMLDRYAGFWNDHVLKEVPPPVQGYGDIQSLFPSPVGTLVAPMEISSWVNEYQDIGKEIGASGALAKRKEQLKVLILEWARTQREYALDDESQEKVVILDATGKRLASYNGKMFRA